MMRRLSYLLLAALLLAGSCTKEGPAEWDGPVIELTLDSGDLQTRAGSDGTAVGIDSYNENLIGWVDFFFYPDGQTDQDATYHVRKEVSKLRSAVIRLEMTSDQVNTIIFPSVTNVRNATVFAVANWPDELVLDDADLSGTSVPELEQKTITTEFANTTHRQASFPMSGTADLGLRGRAQVVAAAGTIPLQRYSCKLTVGLNVADQVVMGDEVWTPMLDGMEIYLVNGVNNVTLGGETTEPHYFSYRSNSLPFAYNDNGTTRFYFDKLGDFYTTFPTYMYPQHWEYGSVTSPRTEPYIKLVLPWARQANPDKGILSTQKQFYYKIVIPDDRREAYRCSFVRNNWYHVNVVVGILGADTDDAMLPIEHGWCFIYDWQDKNVAIKNATIGNARYLSVEQERYELNNVSDPVSLPFVSSHPVSIKNIRVTRPYYGMSNAGANVLGGTVKVAGNNDIYDKGRKYLEYNETQRRALKDDGQDWVRVSETGSAVIFDHPLNNDYLSPLFDCTPYRVTYTLVHSDQYYDDPPAFYHDQTVIQRPAIYMETTINTDYIDPAKNNYAHWGYVYVNGEQYTLAQANADLAQAKADAAAAGQTFNEAKWKRERAWRIVHYSSGGRDMVRLTVTVLPPDTEFVIGDPREDEEQVLGYPMTTDIQWVTDGAGNTLTHYYPTENSSRTIDMIAPEFRISTKHSGTEYDGTTLELARLRCASLQENGFPAGRWRLPTKAEIRFCALLSSHGHFEWQFGGNYWSANGAIYVNKDTGEVRDAPEREIALIRCVYDCWYWGDDQVDIETFTWADAKR